MLISVNDGGSFLTGMYDTIDPAIADRSEGYIININVYTKIHTKIRKNTKNTKKYAKYANIRKNAKTY